METLFRTILNMSVTGAAVICAVLLLRLLLKRAPKKYSYWLWSAAGFRLVCPVSWRSVFSLFSLAPQRASAVAVADVGAVSAITYVPQSAAAVQTGAAMPALPAVGVPAAGEAAAAAAAVTNAHGAPSLLQLAALVWLIGVAAMLLWGAVSWLRLARRLRTAVRMDADVWQSEAVDSPFLMGFVRPRIYIPYGLEGERLDVVLAHERFHIARRDCLVKLLAFLILAVHWFNPLVWLAFWLMGRDLEMRCDEHVLGRGAAQRRPYSETLLSFAAEGQLPGPGPLAFGEPGVKARIKNALRWRRPRLWVSVLAGALCIAAVAACAANPAKRTDAPEPTSETTAPVTTPIPTASAASPDGPGAFSDVEAYLRTEVLRGYEDNGIELYDKDGSAVHVGVAETEIDMLNRTAGDLGGFAAEGWLSSWRYRVRLRLAEDAPELMLADGMTLKDGWLDPDGLHDLVAIYYPDSGRMDILFDAPVNDGMSFLSYHRSYEDALYDWAVGAYGPDLPPYLLDWGEALSAAGNYPVYREDGEGWYFYAPLTGWKLTEASPTRRRWESAHDSGSSFLVREATAAELEAEHPALAEGQALRYFSAPDGRFWCVFTQYNPSILIDSSWVGKEPEILHLMMESFRVTGGEQTAAIEPPALTAEEAEAAQHALQAATDALFAADEGVDLTLYLGSDGPWNTYRAKRENRDGDWYYLRFSLFLSSYTWREEPAPVPEPSEFWLTAVSPDGAHAMTFRANGGFGAVQFDSPEGSRYWTAVAYRYPIPENYPRPISIAWDVRGEYDGLDVGRAPVAFACDDPEAAADRFAHSEYGAQRMNLEPGNPYLISAWDALDWGVDSVLQDGKTVRGWFRAAFIPVYPELSAVWAGNTVEGTGDHAGWLVFFRFFTLEQQADGLWRCVSMGTG